MTIKRSSGLYSSRDLFLCTTDRCCELMWGELKSTRERFEMSDEKEPRSSVRGFIFEIAACERELVQGWI